MVAGPTKQGFVAIEEERYGTSDAKDSSCAAGHSSRKYAQSDMRLEQSEHRASPKYLQSTKLLTQ